MALKPEIEDFLNNIGLDGLRVIMEMAHVEIFRNYMIHNFNWFVSGFKPHDTRHKCELAWYRFYIDHGRLPKQINFDMLFNSRLTEKDVEDLLLKIADAYMQQYGFDVLRPYNTPKLSESNLKLEGF